MRIGTLFGAAMAAIASVGIAVGGSLAFGEWQRGAAARQAVRLTEASASLLRLVETLTIERGNYTIRLAVPTAADEATLARLQTIQRNTDAALAAAVAALAADRTGSL